MPNRRSQSETNILLILRRWMRKMSVVVTSPEYWTEGFLARMLVGLSLLLWAIILILDLVLTYEQEVPPLPLLPLYAFFPGEILSGQINSNPAFLHAWGTGAGLGFLALAFFAWRYKRRWAGIAFMALFLVSTLIVYARVVDQVRALR